MPPKPTSSSGATSSKGPSKKTEMKKKEKVIEDKTFGLKNKKGAKQQKFIQQVEKQVKSGGLNPRKVDLLLDTKKKTTEEELILIKPVQKVEKGADPKSILCAFHKQGQCTKGDKCKFSHDLGIERKAEKRSLYCDLRNDEEQENDTMETWDDDKLKDVVEKKHGLNNNDKNKTEIICRYFLEAVEKSKYGWFWECPNGGTSCMYRHALPPGFILKRDKQLLKDSNKVGLEEWIETERHKLGSKNLTPVNLETFIAWKKRKILEKKENMKIAEEKKFNDFHAGNKIGLSGRDMFTFNPELAQQNDDEEEEQTFDIQENHQDDENDENEYKEINFDDYVYEETEKLLEKLDIDEDLFDEELLDE